MYIFCLAGAFSLSSDRKYPLHCAVEIGAPIELLIALLEINPDAASAVDGRRKIPLQYAIEKSIERTGDISAITLLLQYSAVSYRYPIHVLHEDKKSGTKMWYRAEMCTVAEDGSCVVEYTEKDEERLKVARTLPTRVPKSLIVDKTMTYKVFRTFNSEQNDEDGGKEREDWLIFSRVAKKLEEDDVLGNIPIGAEVEVVGDPQIAEVGDEKMKLFQIVDGLGWIPSRINPDGGLKDLMLLEVRTDRLKHPLHTAIELNASDEVILAVLRGSLGSASVSESRRLPLHSAIVNQCSLEVITQLIIAYPDGCKVPNENGDSALHLAVMKNRPDIANVILEKGGNINLKSSRVKSFWIIILIIVISL